MVTSFFGAESFGGDAAYVDRLSRALLRAGHTVEVVHAPGAYEAVRNGHPGRPYDAPDALEVHRVSRGGRFAALWSHQTGRLGPLGGEIDAIFAAGRFDAIHLHNISLIGGPEAVERATATGAVTLVSAHDHWHVCPLSTLWRPEGKLCEAPRCVRCTLRAGRPPQLWRASGRMARALAGASAVIYPSEHTRQLHADRAAAPTSEVLPYFVPDDGFERPARLSWGRPSRPYIAAAGRLVEEKGFDQLVEAVDGLGEVDAIIAGTGPSEAALARRAAGVPNVRLCGLLSEQGVRSLFAGAQAVVVPSRFWETFGYVLAEAAALGVPAIVRDRGPLAEHARELGLPTFDDARGLRDQLERVLGDAALRERLAATASRRATELWSERDHVSRYVSLIERLRGAEQEAMAATAR